MTPQRCRECRMRLCLSVKDMAAVLGVDIRLVRRWEAGDWPVPPEVAAWLEAAANVPLPVRAWFQNPHPSEN